MSHPDGSNTTLTLNIRRAEEARMRAALGLTAEANTSQPAEDGRQSAGRDNEKPMATRRLFEPPDPSRARIATLTGELKAERGERVAAQQALSDAQRIIQQLQTKLAHAEMAAAEARAAEQKARLEAEAKLGHTPQAIPSKPKADSPTEPKKRGRPPGKRQVVEEPEPQPVKWWLASYKASRAKPPRSRS